MHLLAAINIGQEFFRGNVFGPIDNPLLHLSGIAGIVSLVLNIAFVIAGVSLLAFFIIAGIGLISAAGKNNPQNAEKAKNSLTSAVIGFVVVFIAYWIVKLIQQITGLKFLGIFGPS